MWTNTQNLKPTSVALLREVATFGPGHQGKRQTLDEPRRGEICAALDAEHIDRPPFLERHHVWVDREAKLFESGEYPDKGLTVTPDQIQTLADNFDLPVPVLIEHSRSPLELGYLTQVEARGGQLFGTVSLTKEANDLIESSGAHSLSLGLSEDLSRIVEVSLVKKPRIASARIFNGEVIAAPVDWQAKYQELLAKSSRIAWDDFLHQGKLTPAQVPFAAALLGSGHAVEFDGDSVPVGRVFQRFLEAAPTHDRFTELAFGGSEIPHNLDPEAAAFYQRYFPGTSLEEIARHSGGALNP